MLEVHAVDARDRGGHGQDRHGGRDLAHVLVLAHGHLGQVGLEHGREEVAEALELLVHAQQVVVHVPEVGAHLVRDDVVVAARQRVDGRDQRRGGVVERERLALEPVDALRAVRPGGREDLVSPPAPRPPRGRRSRAGSRPPPCPRSRARPRPGPDFSSSGLPSSRSRTPCRSLASPCRTVITKSSPGEHEDLAQARPPRSGPRSGRSSAPAAPCRRTSRASGAGARGSASSTASGWRSNSLAERFELLRGRLVQPDPREAPSLPGTRGMRAGGPPAPSRRRPSS